MSGLQADFLRVQLNSSIDLKYHEKVEEILKDKRFFEPMTYEEHDRTTHREKVNEKLFRFLKEASKIAPLSNTFNDIALYVALCKSTLIYDDNVVTKLSVNLQLYHKSIVNLGTE